MELDHMPTGCGTWPAWWLFKEPWPLRGEIDIIENVNDMTVNQVSAHVSYNCDQTHLAADDMVARRTLKYPWTHWKDLFGTPTANCNHHEHRSGCAALLPAGTAGPRFNSDGGGAYAIVWDEQGIRFYFWSKSCGGIPKDLECGSPSPKSWGKPMYRIDFGNYCRPSLFGPLHMVINLSFCGTWAGTSEGFASCSAKSQGKTCDDFVRGHPEAFTEAYWKIRSVKVYQLPNHVMADVPPLEPVHPFWP